MPDWLKPALDKYDRQARLKPALLCGAPLVASIVLLVPELGPIWGSIGGVVVYCGGSMLLIQIGRDAGRTLEVRLYQLWGASPRRHCFGTLTVDYPSRQRIDTGGS